MADGCPGPEVGDSPRAPPVTGLSPGFHRGGLGAKEAYWETQNKTQTK